MTHKHVLFVEDNPRQRDLFQAAVSDWNEAQDDGRKFVPTLLDSFDRAEEALERTRFDCALFDLRLPTGKLHPAEEPSGNELARIGLHEEGIPVGIISGKPADLADEFKDSPTVELFFKGEEGDPYRRAIEWFAGHWEMMEVLAASRRKMQSSAAEVFAKRIWPQWASLPAVEQDQRIQIVTRQYVTQMADLLGLEDPANSEWHPFENYIVPAFHEKAIRTGDIFEIDGRLRIVLSPQCDLANAKVLNVVLALCDEEGLPTWADKLVQLHESIDHQQRESRSRYFKDHVNQNLPASLHFLPPLPGQGNPILVRFQNLIAVPFADLAESLSVRRATVSPPFLSNLVQRFGSYISRTGQPNIDVRQF